MSNTNYNTKNKIYTENEKNFNNISDQSLSKLDLLHTTIEDACYDLKYNRLNLSKEKSLHKIEKTLNFIKDYFVERRGYAPDNVRAAKMVDLVDRLLYLFRNDLVAKHWVQPFNKKVDREQNKALGNALNIQLNKIAIQQQKANDKAAKKNNNSNNKTNHSLLSVQPEHTTTQDIKKIKKIVDTETVYALPRNFVIEVAKKSCDLKLHQTEVPIILSMMCDIVQGKWNETVATDNKNNSNNNNIYHSLLSVQPEHTTTQAIDFDTQYELPESYCYGYRLKPNFEKMWQGLKAVDGTVHTKIARDYKHLKDAVENNKKIYSFNRSENWAMYYGPKREIAVNALMVDKDNIDDLNEGDIVVNVINFNGFDWDKIISKINRLKNRLVQDVLNKRRSWFKAQLLEGKIEYLMGMIDFIREKGYYVDLYEVSPCARLYAKGITFQNLSKELRKIVFYGFVELDQKCAHLNILKFLSETQSDLIDEYLSDMDKAHEIIKQETGKGKRAFKKLRSMALNGKIYTKNWKGQTMIGEDTFTFKLLSAIVEMSKTVSKVEIHKEERRRTLALCEGREILQWLHDGAIVRK